MAKKAWLLLGLLISRAIANDLIIEEGGKLQQTLPQYFPIRISAEFINNIFPENIDRILIYDTYQNKQTLVGIITSASPNEGARWPVVDAYDHSSVSISLCYEVVTGQSSPLYPIPVYNSTTNLLNTVFGEEYVEAVRISFSGNLNSPIGIRASLKFKLTRKGFTSQKQFESTKKDITVEEGCPENDRRIFNSLISTLSLVKPGYTEDFTESEIREIIRLMDAYINKYGESRELNLEKIVQAFCQNGFFRSDMIGPLTKLLEEEIEKKQKK